MHLYRTLSLVLAGCALGACSPDPAAADRHVRQARALIERQQYELALQEIENALAVDPKHLHARFHKGEILYNTARLDAAAEVFTQLSEEYPADVNITRGLAYVHKDKGNYLEALKAYAKLPFSPEKVLPMAECLLAVDQHRQAANMTSEFLANDPWHQAAYLLLSKIEAKRSGREAWAKVWGDYYRSMEKMREANNQARGLESQGRLPEAALAYGRTLYRNGRFFDAMRRLGQALELNPNLAPAHLTIGRIQLDTGYTKDAIASIEKALSMQPEKENWKKRLAEAKARLAADGGKDVPTLELAQKHAQSENYDGARACALFEAKRDQTSIPARRFVGIYFNRQQDAFVRLWAWRAAADLDKTREEFKEYLTKGYRELAVDLSPVEPPKPDQKPGQPGSGNGRPAK